MILDTFTLFKITTPARARVCLLTASALALLAPVGAAEKVWLTVGRGSESCGTFVRAIDAMAPMPSGKAQSMNWQNKTWVEEGYAFQTYLFGFVTGVNLDASKQIKVDGNGIVLWIRHYCESHADESINTAISAFVQEQRTKSK
jgi:hypothetical protein